MLRDVITADYAAWPFSQDVQPRFPTAVLPSVLPYYVGAPAGRGADESLVPGAGVSPSVATAVAGAYPSFARLEARGRSAAYESLAESVADDPAVVGLIASLPLDKRQPNLLFAAARYLLGEPPGIQQLRDLIRTSRAELTHVILTRCTQTNEPARCAVLLAGLGPVAGAARADRGRCQRRAHPAHTASHTTGAGIGEIARGMPYGAPESASPPRAADSAAYSLVPPTRTACSASARPGACRT